MKNLIISAIFVSLVASLTGCYHSSTVNTPVGTEKNRMYALGIVSTSNVDTDTKFERCRDLLKPGHPLDASMIDREVYDKCFADAMQHVEPGRGQQPSPTPMDANGDGRPDFYQYKDGFQVPADLYQMYPGMYWPGVYQNYGYGPGDVMYGSAPMSYQQGYAPVSPMGYGPADGGWVYGGSAQDPAVTYNRMVAAGQPVREQEYVTREETISREQARALRDVSLMNARRSSENAAAINGANAQPQQEASSEDAETK